MMKTLKSWLDDERGRYTALALHLGVSVGRVSQMAKDGVPPKDMLSVRDFTNGAVSLEAMVSARTPGVDEPDGADHERAAAVAAPALQRRDGPSNPKGR
jgi:DNA-binding transcriptional regulator YdaS (Cro superfamily)